MKSCIKIGWSLLVVKKCVFERNNKRKKIINVMNDIIFCDLWDEEDGIYVQFDDGFDITSDEYRDILIN